MTRTARAVQQIACISHKYRSRMHRNRIHKLAGCVHSRPSRRRRGEFKDFGFSFQDQGYSNTYSSYHDNDAQAAAAAPRRPVSSGERVVKQNKPQRRRWTLSLWAVSRRHYSHSPGPYTPCTIYDEFAYTQVQLKHSETTWYYQVVYLPGRRLALFYASRNHAQRKVYCRSDSKLTLKRTDSFC